MTDTLQERLRHGANNIHSIGPDRAADLLSEAAACFDHDAKVEANMAKRVAHAQHDAAMWRKRCERYEAWWALPQEQRHPGGPEFSGADTFAATPAGPRLIANLPPPGPLTCDCSKGPDGRVQVCVHLRARLEELGGEDPLVIQLREITGKYNVLVPAAEHLRKAVMDEIAITEREKAERRAFLERAVCHPGPPASEHDDYDPEAPLGELEAAVLERMDLELKAEREVQNWRDWAAAWMRWPSAPNPDDRKLPSAGMREFIEERLMREMRLEKELNDLRGLCEKALGRTPDPARSTMQVVRDLLAQPTTMQRLGERCRERRAAERAAAADLVPIVRPEHFAGPFPAISGYVKRTAAARAATIDQALRMLKLGQSLAVHDEPERVDILFLDPGQYPPLGQTWTVYGPMVLDDQLASATGSEIPQDAVAEHIRAAGGDPAAATLAQIADAMNATDSDFTYKPNAAGDGLDATPVQRAGAGGTIEIVGGDQETITALGLERPLTPAEQANHVDRTSTPHPKAAEFQNLINGLRGKHAGALNSPELRARLQTEITGFMAAQRDVPPLPNVEIDDERSDLPNGKIAFKVRVSPELAAAIERQRDEEAADRMRRAVTYRPGSPIPEPALSQLEPREDMTPEQEAEQEERLARFDHDWD